MKKTLSILALGALAGLSGSASAQSSNVQIYGYIDLGLVKESGKTPRMDRGQNNWLGFKGTEQLGGDLAAIFNVQMRFNPDTGGAEKSTAFFQGETTVGLASTRFGTVRLGRALTPLWAKKWIYDPWYDSALMGSLANYNGDFNSDGLVTVDYHNYSRASNAVYYSSPDMAGFSVHADAEIERAVGDDAARTIAETRQKGISLNYANGGLNTMLAYEKNHIDSDIVYVAGGYTMGAFTLLGSYSETKFARVNDKLTSMMLAATYMVGIDTIRGGYGKIKESGNDKFTVGVNHPLSKRTNLYADLYREKLVDVDGSTGVALGINHTF
ncbi:porin [Actimicrobium sp. CCC2.4]|uniref:porin n=1 Tax=Actimicrobium sp. CCC2.4 TaxID=3048606 RepID=UPI002AC9CE7F|nr:porin [Actimicrobium sp. CCC2.4]MEB0136522.1 porin [Actimicrobium sp. CCC2.4]WPX30882.1 porin [Actimicrobium sp. CCC2.4]